MALTRRGWVLGVGALPVLASTAAKAAQPAPGLAPMSPIALPDKASFAANDGSYLDAGSQHPVPLASMKATEAYFAKRMLQPSAAGYDRPDDVLREKFAKLVGAKGADEIGYVQSTTAGEQIVLRGLGFPEVGGHIVVDELHFFGSLPAYIELQRHGVEVTWVKAVDNRIPLASMKAAIRKDTKLVAVSAVSTINGFQHDLKAVCDLAHENGALVYVDMIHSAGCVPMNLEEAGVDFAASSTYKWLMGDFGLGFAYARKESQAKLRRTEYGYETIDTFSSHIYPLDPPGAQLVDYGWMPTAEGIFAHGTQSSHVVPMVDRSLDYINTIGVDRIQAHAQGLIGILRKELPKMGHTIMTPEETTSPLLACVYAAARQKLADRLRAAKVNMTLRQNAFRFSVSVFNDERDIERALAAIGRA